MLIEIVAKYEVIQGDTSVQIGDRPSHIWRKDFEIRNIATGPSLCSFLIFNVRGLTAASRNVEVQINDTKVGVIYPYTSGEPGNQNWYTQMINFFSDNVLHRGENTIKVIAETWAGTTEDNTWDDFYLKDVIIFFPIDVAESPV
jgi:hypothetical protein